MKTGANAAHERWWGSSTLDAAAVASGKAIITVAVFTLVFCVRATSAAEMPVGYASVNVPGNTSLRGDASGRLNVIVWYPAPARTTMRPIALGPPLAPYFSEGRGAKDAPLASAPARRPFVVVSHGTGGTALDLVWLCAGLAARGYIVAAVEHPGNNALHPPTVAGATVWWMRADDLSRTIDGVLALPRFGPFIDRTRIGAAGASLGGYTVLVLAGARADRGLLDAYCVRKPDTPVCSGEATPEMPDLRAKARALAAVDSPYRAAVAANMDSHRDGRVKAIFSIEPAEGPAIVPQSLTTIDVPIAFVAGLGDRILPVIDNVIPDALAVRHGELTLFPRPVGHHTFFFDCAPAGRLTYAAICGDAGSQRVTVHHQTLELAASFFARTIGVTPLRKRDATLTAGGRPPARRVRR